MILGASSMTEHVTLKDFKPTLKTPEGAVSVIFCGLFALVAANGHQSFKETAPETVQLTSSAKVTTLGEAAPTNLAAEAILSGRALEHPINLEEVAAAGGYIPGTSNIGDSATCIGQIAAYVDTNIAQERFNAANESLTGEFTWRIKMVEGQRFVAISVQGGNEAELKSAGYPTQQLNCG